MNTSRRQFLRNTTTALAATALGAPFLSGCASHGGTARPRKLKKAIMYATIGYKGSVLEKFRAVKAAGFEGVEAMSHMNQDEVVKAYAETGLKCASVCCATHWNKTLSHPDEKVRAEGLEGLQQALRDAWHKQHRSDLRTMLAAFHRGDPQSHSTGQGTGR